MWKNLQEGSSVLPSMKQVTPSDRTGVSGNEGIGDRSDVGKTPTSGQGKIWGNLNNQSRGMVGKLDTQGKDAPEMFTDKRGATKTTNPGTSTPGIYKKMYAMHENANGKSTGQQSGKHKVAGVNNNSGISSKYVEDGDFRHGGSSNCPCGKKSKPMTEDQLVGSTVAIIASKLLSENFGISLPVKN